jgi:hypothetical protein
MPKNSGGKCYKGFTLKDCQNAAVVKFDWLKKVKMDKKEKKGKEKGRLIPVFSYQERWAGSGNCVVRVDSRCGVGEVAEGSAQWLGRFRFKRSGWCKVTIRRFHPPLLWGLL